MEERENKTIMNVYQTPGIVAVDFDGTVVDHCYPSVGEDVPFAVETMKDMSNLGYLFILNTMRSGTSLKDATDWFAKKNVPLHAVGYDPKQKEWTTSNKCYAQLYIDDIAFGTPLIRPRGFYNDCVDWRKIREAFQVDKRIQEKQSASKIAPKIYTWLPLP